MRIDHETIVAFNKKLHDIYGETENRSNFRLIYSEDEYEKRYVSTTPEGLQLLYPELREVPKYKHYIQNRYILERLTVVPAIQQREMIVPLSYEPIWTFEDKHGRYLPPKWEAIYWIMQTVMGNLSAAGLYKKYSNPKDDPKIAADLAKKEIDDTMEELFGNETRIGDALAHEEAVFIPSFPQTPKGQ